MGGEPVFLRPGAVIDPLAGRFCASLHAVALGQAAVSLAFLQVPLLGSCLQSPRVHVDASGSRQFRGGFFVGVGEGRAGGVRRALAGLVELAYGAGSQASPRFIGRVICKGSLLAEDGPWVSSDCGAAGRCTCRDLPGRIGLALATRGYGDHVVLEALLQPRGRVGAVVAPQSSRGRTFVGAAQAAAIMTEPGAAGGCVHAMGGENWPGHVMAASHTGDSCPLKQVGEFMAWRAGNGIKSGRLR
jgi:hypothetical protein